MTGPNMDTFGQRQARRFHERKGYDRASLHNYRPHAEALNPSARAKRLKFWFLNLKEDARRRRNDTFKGFA